MVLTAKEVQTLQNRVIDLERQLAEAQTAIKASSLPGQKKPEANAVQQKAEELNAIIQTLHDPVMVYDQNGVISLANASAVRAHGFDPTGYHRRETNQTLMVRYPDGRIVHPDELPSARALKGETVVDEALTITNSHGQELSLLVTSSPLIVNGIQRGAVSVWHDITERKHTEETLRKSEAKYRSLVETAFEGVWVVDTEGHTMFVNHRMAEILKYDSPDDLMDRSAFDFVPAEDLEQLKARFRIRLNTKRSEQYDVRLRCRDGSIIWASAASNNVLDDHGNVVGRMALFMDITERKVAEEALRESETRYRTLFESIDEGFSIVEVLFDDLGNPIDYRFLETNPAFAKQTGLHDAVGKRMRELAFSHEDDRFEIYGRVALTGRSERFTSEAKQLDDRWYDVYAFRVGHPEGRKVAILFTDITKRKQAEERFNKAFHASPSALVISRQRDGRIETINDMFISFFGYSAQEVIGKTSVELGMFVNPADRQEAVRRLQIGKSVRDFELEVRLKSGEIRSVSLSTELMNIGNEDLMLTTIQDITDRKRFETALLKRESILAQAGEIAHLGAWDIEFQNQDDVNANPLNWSDEVYRIFGYAPGEVKPSNELFFERVHPDDRARVQENIAQAIATRQPYIIEHRVCRPDGEERVVQEHAEVFFDEMGKPLRIVGAVQDITERKHAEEALRASEERFRFLADSMPQLVWTALPNGTVDYYNSRYLEYQEIKQVKVAAWEWAPVLHPNDLQPTVDAWQHSLETGEIYQIEHRVRMTDGSYRWHLSRGVPVHDEKRQIIRWFGTATDIHDTKLAEEQLKIYTERLERSNHELEQFAFMASHDLQEPLRKIEVFGDLLLESSVSLNGRERNYLDRMRDAAGRMRDMVDGLLQLSRVTTQGKPFVQVSLSQVIEDVLYDLENQIRRTGGKVDVTTLPAIDGDPLQLRQLMQNLIGNALKYHQSDSPPEVKVHAKQLSGNVQILVEDNGIGFEQADAERIFQPFQRLVGRSQYEGSGMGLAICRRIVERHGGEITAHSKPGRGATFIVSLPMYQTKGAGKEPNNEEATSTSGRGR